jgi:hypothetical protein
MIISNHHLRQISLSTSPSASQRVAPVHAADGIGSFSDSLNWFYAHCASHHDSLGTHSSMITVASWAMKQVIGVFLQDNAKKNCKTDFPQLLFNCHHCTRGLQFCVNFTHPILMRISDLQADVGFNIEALSQRHQVAESGVNKILSAGASPSNQMVNTNLTTPQIRDLAKLSSSTTKIGQVTTRTYPPPNNSGDSSIESRDGYLSTSVDI